MSSYRPTAEQTAEDEGDLEAQVAAQLAELRLSVGPGAGELISQEELDAALEEMANLRLSVREQQGTSDSAGFAATTAGEGDDDTDVVASGGSFYENTDETDLAHARAVAKASASAHKSVRASARAREPEAGMSGMSGMQPLGTPAGVVQMGLPVPPEIVIEPPLHTSKFPTPLQQLPPLVVASWNCKPNTGKLGKREVEPLATFLLARVRPGALLLQEPYQFASLAKSLQLPYRFLPAVGSHAQVCRLDI
jgi:hypothetical protein